MGVCNKIANMHFDARYSLMEMGLDSPDLPTAMVSGVHLKRCEKYSLSFFFFQMFLSFVG